MEANNIYTKLKLYSAGSVVHIGLKFEKLGGLEEVVFISIQYTQVEGLIVQSRPITFSLSQHVFVLHHTHVSSAFPCDYIINVNCHQSHWPITS